MRETKDSGVEWIGEIPKYWDIRQVRSLFKIGRGRVISQQELDENGEYPVYSSQTKDDGCLGFIGTYDYNVEQITWTTDGANAGTVFIRNGKHNCTNVCGTLQASDLSQSLRYQKYALEHIAYYHKRADTNGFKIMNNEMAAIHTICPPLFEQHRIADYLDTKCAQIDRAIARQQEVIEKLKEYKLSVITEAVTKGLNLDVPMKDSGIEWIGEIPEHWAMLRLRYVGTCQNGISKDGESFGSGYPFISYSDVYKNFVVPEKASALVESSDEERTRFSVCRGDVFFTRTSETIEEIGLTAVCLKTIDEATFAGFLIRVRPFENTLYSEFSKYYFRSEKHRRFFVKEMNLITRASLGQELLKRLPVLLPPMEEQQEIAEYLDEKCLLIESVASGRQQVIDKLTEYKKSLIYEAVTGKREV